MSRRRAPVFEVERQLSTAAAERLRYWLPKALRGGLPIVLEEGIRFAGTYEYEPRPHIRLAQAERWLTR